MYKLATVGALVAAVAIPASAAGQGAPAAHARAQALCPQVVFLPGRSYGFCGGRFWIRDSRTGKAVPASFWRLQHLSDPQLADQP